MSYRPDFEDYHPFASRRAPITRTPGEWPTSRRDETADLYRLLEAGTAACRTDPDTDRWVDVPLGRKELTEMRRICDNCPVQQACLEYGLRYAVVGYWGGSTDQERIRLRRGNKPIPLQAAQWIERPR